MYIYDDHIIVFLPYFFPLEKNYYHERLGNKNEGSFWNTFFSSSEILPNSSTNFFFSLKSLAFTDGMMWNWCNLTLLHTQTLKNRIKASFFFCFGVTLVQFLLIFFSGKHQIIFLMMNFLLRSIAIFFCLLVFFSHSGWMESYFNILM